MKKGVEFAGMDGSIGRVSGVGQKPAQVSPSPESAPVVASKSRKELIRERYHELKQRIEELAAKYRSSGMPPALAWAHAKRVVLTPRAEWSRWGRKMLATRANAARWAHCGKKHIAVT